MKTHLAVFGALAAASLALTGGVAAAQAPSASTTIQIEGSHGELVSDLHVFGTVSSPTRACVADRKVKIFALGPNGRKLVDTARAGTRGFFRGGGDFGREVDGMRVKATRTVVSRNGRRLVCEPDAQSKVIL